VNQLPSARWIAAAAMCVFMALALVAHAFAVASDRDAGEGRIRDEIEEILTTDEARQDFEETSQEDSGFRIPGTDIRIGVDTDVTYDEFVERTSDGLSEALYEGGPDEADELLRTLEVEEPGDSALDFFAEPEDPGFLDEVFNGGDSDPLAFFSSDGPPLEEELAQVLDEAGDDDIATLDAHQAITRLRLTFVVLTLASAVTLGVLVQGGGLRLLAPATVAMATSFPFAVFAFLLYVVLRPDEEVSLGSLFELLDISIGDILRDYMIVFGVSALAVIVGLIWTVVASQRPRALFERAFPPAGSDQGSAMRERPRH
jgi:hypothetical protein